MNRIKAIDYWLVLFIEKQSHKIQRFTGKDCVFQKLVVCLSYLGIFMVGIFSEVIEHPVLSSILGFVFFTLSVFELYMYPRNSEDAIKRIERGHANILKLWGFPLRMFSLVIALSWGWHSPVFFLYPLWIYLESCDPLPPQKSKVVEWVKGLFSGQLVPAKVNSR